jgi:sugar phosphate isomerase/epimerase
MKSTSRRSFIKASALMPFVFNDAVFNLAKANPLLSFSTLGCPKWTFKEIVDFAAGHQYKGIEIRGIQGQLDLTQCAEFSTPGKIKETRKLVQEKGLKIINLGASTELHHSDAATRQKNLDQGKKCRTPKKEIK